MERCLLIEYKKIVKMFEKNKWDRTGTFKNLFDSFMKGLYDEHGYGKYSGTNNPECTCETCEIE